MKIPNFVKVGGTTIAALILSACGSSGGDDSPSVKSSANTTPTTPVVPAPTAKEDQSVKAFNAAKAAEQAQESAIAANADAAKKEDLASAKDALKQVQAAQAAANSAAQAAAAAAAKAKAENAENAAMAADYAKRAADAVKALDIIAAGTQELVAKRMKQDDANKSVAVTSTPSNNGRSHVGYQHTQKVQSDLDLDGMKKPANNDSNTAKVMREQDIHNERDTIVVARHRDNNKEFDLYLHDMDLKKVKTNPQAGVGGLSNHRVAVPDTLAALVIDNNNRPETNLRTIKDDFGLALVNDTKTMEKGVEQNLDALIYTDNAPLYIDVNSGLKADDRVVRYNPTTGNRDWTSWQNTPAANENYFGQHALIQDGTISQVYGAKTTFARQTGGAPAPYNPVQGVTQNARNLPLVGASLQHVQYGRVTSQISGRELDAFVDGLNKNVKIAPYGAYGQPGTENHYFARGVNNTNAIQLANMKGYYGTPEMTYLGHAVGYGMNNQYRNERPMRVPNALGGTEVPYLMSGNHFRAKVNLDTKQVDGSVYNQWFLAVNDNPNHANSRVVESKLVEFAGTLANNGNIAGNAVNLTKDNSPGILNATLFGSRGEEMGGTIVSKEPEKVQWGLSFGAINTTPRTSVVSPTPNTPKNVWEADQRGHGGTTN